jgi:hypothetical protein
LGKIVEARPVSPFFLSSLVDTASGERETTAFSTLEGQKEVTMSWFWSNWFKRLGFDRQEGGRRSRKGTRKPSRPGVQLRLDPLEQRNLLSTVLPPVHPPHPRHGNGLNGNATALASMSAAVVGRHVLDPHGAVSVLATNFTGPGGINFGGGELSPQFQAGGLSSENVYGGPVVLLGGGDGGVIIIAPDGVHVVGPWGPETPAGELAATGAGLAGRARRGARTIHPAELAKAKAQLSKELPAIRAAVLNGTGLTFTTRDLMISVLTRADTLCDDCATSCQNASFCGIATDDPCFDSVDNKGDPWEKIINPAELSELQAVLKQAVLQNPALSGGQR